MKKIAYLLLTISFCGLTACKTGTKKGGNMDNETLVKIETTLGNIKVKLYNETPKHRDNFIKLAEDGVYEGTLFHRVIKDFMIQAGDPDSKNAPKGKMLGAGDVGYTLPAEFAFGSMIFAILAKFSGSFFFIQRIFGAVNPANAIFAVYSESLSFPIT